MAHAAKDLHALSTYWEKAYEKRYGEKPVINRNTAKWNWSNMLDHLSAAEVKELIDFYFSVKSVEKHSLPWFFYNYEKIMITRQEQIGDAERRERLRRESEERARKWRERVGDKGITSN